MRLTTKVLIGILSFLIVTNCGWVIYDIKKEIQQNKTEVGRLINENKESLDNIYSILTLMDKTDNITINTVNSLNGKVDKLPQKISADKVKIEKTLQQINIMVRNITDDSLGSGVTLKYNGKFYVLSAGHMTNSEEDKLELWENDQKICDLEIVKHEYTTPQETTKGLDLILLRPTTSNIVPKVYTELADTEPSTSTEVYIVGNPMGIEDVVSDGRIIIYKNNFMYYIDHTYFGNSGCGIYTHDGKLVGIVSHMIPIQPNPAIPPYTIHGAVRLNVIKEFLRDIK